MSDKKTDEPVQNAFIPGRDDDSGDKPFIFVRTEGGAILKLDLPLQEAIHDRMANGQIVRVKNLKGDPYTGNDPLPEETEAQVPVVPEERPGVNGTKADWVAFSAAEAVRRGIDVTVDDLQAATKQDLIERFGAGPEAA